MGSDASLLNIAAMGPSKDLLSSSSLLRKHYFLLLNHGELKRHGFSLPPPPLL